MNGSCFIILYICAPSVYGYASEWKRALPPAGPTAIAPQRLTCSSFPGCTFTGLALLQSSCPSNQCLAFLARTMIHFLLVPFLLDRTHCANFSSVFYSILQFGCTNFHTYRRTMYQSMLMLFHLIQHLRDLVLCGDVM